MIPDCYGKCSWEYEIATRHIVQVPRPKNRLILRVSLTHLAESRDLPFLEAEIVDNMRQTKSYDDLFQATRASTVQKFLKIRILS